MKALLASCCTWSVRIHQNDLIIFSRLLTVRRSFMNNSVAGKPYHQLRIENVWKHPTSNGLSKKSRSVIVIGSNSSNPVLSSMAKAAQVQQNSTHSFSTSTVKNVQSSQASDNLIFSDFPTIQAAEYFFGGIHNLTGLPWWASIIISAFFLRVVLPLPLSIYSMHNAVRLHRLQPEIKDIALRLRKETSMAKSQFGWTQKKAKGEYIKNLKGHLRELYIRDNCHPMKDTASFWIRIPLWVSASYALRNMSVRANNPQFENHESCQSMSSEGIAWFTDLAVVDSTWALPVMMGAVTLLNVEIGRRNIADVTTYRKVITFGLRGLSLAFIPISSYLPSGMVLYWVCSGCFSAMQTVMIDRSPTFRKLIGIKMPDQSNP